MSAHRAFAGCPALASQENVQKRTAAAHAMHAEGGPEASLSIRAGEVTVDLCGSYETGFNENDGNHQQWPIPNVNGVVAR